MRVMLLKPIEGLEVGQIYDLIEQRGGYLTWRNITTNEEIEYIYNGGYKTFFNYWFIFQELPEQLKEQIEETINKATMESIASTRSGYASIEEVARAVYKIEKTAVSAVRELLEGDTKDE